MLKRIVLVSPSDPRNVDQWSGSTASLYQSLVLNSPRTGCSPSFITANPIDLIARALNRLLAKCGLRIDLRFTKIYALGCGILLWLKLLFRKDVLLVGVAASNCLAYLRTRSPIVYVSDGTFSAMSQLYPGFRSLPTWVKRQGEHNERQALRRSRFVVYPSTWAMQSAEREYAVPATRIHVIPFGPNIPPPLI